MNIQISRTRFSISFKAKPSTLAPSERLQRRWHSFEQLVRRQNIIQRNHNVGLKKVKLGLSYVCIDESDLKTVLEKLFVKYPLFKYRCFCCVKYNQFSFLVKYYLPINNRAYVSDSKNWKKPCINCIVSYIFCIL